MRWIAAAVIAFLVALPFLLLPIYFLHLLILVLMWSFIGTSWALMGRFGLVSLGHGGFMGVGVYTSALLWNYAGLTPWLGIPLGIGLAVLLALVVGYPAFRFRVMGHYFALVTLALGEVVRLSIIAARDYTGGSLGMTPNPIQPATPVSWYALQFADKRFFYFIALAVWLLGLHVYDRVSRGMPRAALEAISEDEVAAASVGIRVTRHKLRITLISAGMTALGGILLGQYNQYLNPNSLSGIAISLDIVFSAIVGGMYSLPGPTVGALLTILFRESLRTFFGVKLIGMAETIYGLLLIVFIIFMPRGIYGTLADRLTRSAPPSAPPTASPPLPPREADPAPSA
jgi:branched-chain amino acid transport system permease protein